MSLASTSLSSSEKDTFVEHLFKPESDSSDSASSLHKRSCKPSGMVANHCLTMRGREEIEREREREGRREGKNNVFSSRKCIYTCDTIGRMRYLHRPVSA